MGFIKPNNNSGGSGGGLTPQELSRLNNAYTHSKSEHAPTTAEQNVQPDWNETDTTSDAYIKNKPDLSQIGSGGNIPSVKQIEPQELDMPKVFFYGNALPTTKDNVNLTMDYISNTTKFSSFIKLKCQGTSSMSYAKKNFTVSMFSDEARETKLKKDFKGWGKQSKFCLKANYVDTTHTRNLSGARIAYDMVASRPDSEFKQQLLQCPRNGAVDGFPIKLYFNGEFYGIYTWNIPKDAWMFNMNEENPNHCVLCAERNTDGNANAINSCQFRQLWTNGDGQDWSVEVGTMSEDLRTKFNRVIAFVMNATDQEFHDNISNYFDLYSLLDYYCFSYLTCHLDGLAKNMLMVTYDGVIWGASLYDMDSIYGVSWNGGSFVSPQYQCPEQYQEQFSLLWQRIERCFGAELYARYLELRQGALSLSNIVKHVEEIYDVIPDRVFADEKAKWAGLPQVNTNTMTRFRNYMRDRAVYVDAQMQEIGVPSPNVECTGITLDKHELVFSPSTSEQPSEETIDVTQNTTAGYLICGASEVNNNGGMNSFGNTKSSTQDTVTDFIPFTSNDTLTISQPSSNYGCVIVVYNSDKQGLACYTVNNTWEAGNTQSGTELKSLTMDIPAPPSETAYIRISFNLTNLSDVTVVKKYTNNAVGSHQLIATVTPDNCTQPVVWSVSPEGIVTVNNGLVTAVTNGEATVTATCGTQSDTCAVTVSGMSSGDEVRNAWESATWTEKYYDDGGNLTPFDVIHHSSLIPVNGNEIITVECDASITSPYLRLSFFDSDSQYIGYDRGAGYNATASTNDNSITVNLIGTFANIAYVSINANTNNKSLVTVSSTNSGYSIIDVSTTYVNGNLNRNSGAVTSGTAGTVTENSVDITSDYIDCSNPIKISVSDTIHVIGAVAYNKNKEYLATYDGQNKIWHSEGYDDSTMRSNLLIATFPDTAKYIRFTVGSCTNSSLITVKTLGINGIGGDTDIYATAEYAITEPRTFNGASDYIDTGIKLFDTAKTFTVFIDYASTTPVEKQAVIFHCIHEASPYRGLCIMKNSSDASYFIGGQASGQNTYATSMSGNGKYLISFVNGVINNVVTIDNSGNLVYSATDIASNNPYVQISENLLIGCYQNTSGTKGRYWSGTINKFGVWYKQLTENEINEVFGISGGGNTGNYVTDNLYAYYDLTQLSTEATTVEDLSGNNNTFNVVSGTLTKDDLGGLIYNNNNNTPCIKSTTFNPQTTVASIEYTFKYTGINNCTSPNNYANRTCGINGDNGGGYYCWLGGYGYSIFKRSTNIASDIALPSTLVNGEYYHVVCTFSDSEVKIYINGELLGTHTHNITGIPTNCIYYLGNTNGVGATAQALYSSRFYNKVLTQDEITQNYTYEFTKLGLISGGGSDISDGCMSYMIQYQSEPEYAFALHTASTSTDCQGFECTPSFKGFAFPTDVNDTDISYMICDSMPTVSDSEKKVNNIPCIAGAFNGVKNYLTVKVLKSNASTVDEFKTYFRENPTYIKIKPKDTVHKYSIDIDNVEMLTTTHSTSGYTCGEFIVNDLPTTNYSASNVFISNLGYSPNWTSVNDWSYFKISEWEGNVYVGFQIKNELLETQDLEGIRKYIAKDPNIYYIN